MPRDLGGQAAEGLDDEDEQDGLGPAQAALDDGGVLVDEEQGLAQGLEDVVGQEEKEDVEGEQEGLGRFAAADVGEKPEEPVAGRVVGRASASPFPRRQNRTFASPLTLICFWMSRTTILRRALSAPISSAFEVAAQVFGGDGRSSQARSFR